MKIKKKCCRLLLQVFEKRLKGLFPLASVARILQLFNTNKKKADARHMWLFEM